ncbi:hypothetical protein M422DRAFT_218002 [Sphaerobolus stellatus SS14]|nr:hypothetical protein M422DRAFT_218002 [Sphaerobolus stellatus SS14]
MSLPPVNPSKTVAGIIVDPKTLDRVVPESRRPDGSVRKELRIRPGFTPQEDVSRFRTSRQIVREQTALPKGHIPGWVAPSSETKPKPKEGAQSKSAKKNEKRKAKKEEKKQELIKASWDSDSDEATPASSSSAKASGTKETAKEARAKDTGEASVEDLNTKFKNLEVQSS